MQPQQIRAVYSQPKAERPPRRERAFKWLEQAASRNGCPRACAPQQLLWLQKHGLVKSKVKGEGVVFFATSQGRDALAAGEIVLPQDIGAREAIT